MSKKPQQKPATNTPNPYSLKGYETGFYRYLPFIFLAVAYALIIGEPSSRMFWPYMLSSYLMAYLVYLAGFRNNYKTALDYMFPREVWLSPSAINDYVLFIINYFVFLNFVTWLFDPDVVKIQIFALLKYFGAAQHTGEPGLMAAVIYTFCALLLAELFYYITHRAYHEIPFLWEFHKVHHSATVMTPLTYIRAHPIDLWIQNFMKLLSVGIASGVFLYLYPNMKGVIMVGSVDAGIFIYYLFGANLHHSHIWLSFGPKIERILISPAQHQIHHSDDPKHFNRNYGSMLAVWDWLFGSLYVITGHEKIKFGLGKENEKYDSISKLYLNPVIGSLRVLKKSFQKRRAKK